MAATAAQISRLRRMIAEPETTTYSDEDLAEAIERYPVIDARGVETYYYDTSTIPPTQTAMDNWLPTYDLCAAAADLWAEKAATLAADYDFSADGASYSRRQAYDNAMASSAYYRARRSPRALFLRPEPEAADLAAPSWVGNAAELED